MLAAIAGLIGILLGGLLKAWEARTSRKAEAAGVLSALVAEVEAITRFIGHREFVPRMAALRQSAEAQIASGHGDDEADFFVLFIRQNYFSTFDALSGRLGTINPYWADRITRFYTYAKAVTENYHPESLYQQHVTARQAFDVYGNDLQLLQTVVLLGAHIAENARKIKPPKNVADLFPSARIDTSGGFQPAMPPVQPQDADSQALGVTKR